MAVVLAGENFEASIDIRILFMFCALISSAFIIAMLYLAEKVLAKSLKRKILIACILITHLIVGYFFPQLIDYYKFIEIAGNLVTVILIVLLHGILWENGKKYNVEDRK